MFSLARLPQDAYPRLSPERRRNPAEPGSSIFGYGCQFGILDDAQHDEGIDQRYLGDPFRYLRDDHIARQQQADLWRG